MKMIWYLPLIAFSSLFFSCCKENNDILLSDDRVDTIEIRLGENKNIYKGLTLTFDSVITDSRCPINVECIWQGFANIKLSINQN